MRNAVLQFLLLIWAYNSQAQPTIQRYYIANGTALKNLEQLASGNLFTGIAYGSGISIMDAQGNLIQSHNCGGVPYTRLQSVRKHTDNEFYFVQGVIADSCTVVQSLVVDPVFGKMDSLGNILALHHYQLNAVTCSNTAWDFTITSEGGAVLWGNYETFFALRVNQTGSPIWSKQFAYHGSFTFLRELPSGDLLAGFNMDTAGACLARLNAAGEMLWCKSYIRPKGYVYDCLVESDDSFIVTGYTDSIASTNAFVPLPTDFQPKLFVMKVNGSGAVDWCKGYSGDRRWYARSAVQVERTLDNNYIMLSALGDQTYNLWYRPFLMKTDQNGDVLWSRSVGANGYTYNVAHLMTGLDGGFYFDGTAYGEFGQWSGATYLFKTDSLGHLPCHEQAYPVQITDLFPVDSTLSLSAVEGAVAIETSNTEVTYDPIVVFDGCTFTTGLPPKPRSYRSMRVHPNPNTGHFTLTFKDPLQAESYYSVYDAAGKLLYQRPLPTGKGTEEVDLSRYGKGTYVIKCTDKEGVYHEQVVVE